MINGIMIRSFFLLAFSFLLFTGIRGQDIPPVDRVFKVAIVAPLYLDSAFNGGIVKDELPRYMSAGLDFVQGAEIALDSLNTGGKKIEVHIIDSKGIIRSLQWMMKYGNLGQMDLIIAGVRTPEYKELADFAFEKRIPMISAVYPNDGAIRKDSLLVIMNSTLKSNLEGVYDFIVQKHGSEQILLIKKPYDDRIDEYFKDINQKNGNQIKFRSIALDSINSSQLSMLIDTLRPAVVIGATLDEGLGVNIADACLPYKEKITLIGMPNWNGFRDLFDKRRFLDFPILYPTPHFIRKENIFNNYLDSIYFSSYRKKPGEMAARGFESAWYFINILMKFDTSFMEHLNEQEFESLHPLRFRPVSIETDGGVDYFENKHIFILQIVNGFISEAD